MTGSCGCCSGVARLTPETIANRPGLDAIRYRVGTHATFIASMEADLTRVEALRALRTRSAEDPAIALLDAWATVADVLSFYQERIANEGFLQTATERRSILELAHLIGYRLRPGVASSVYLAFTLEPDYKVPVPVGTRAQSLPGPGELPQSFETSDTIAARTAWNILRPRRIRPQRITAITARGLDVIYFKGTSTGLSPNDPILIRFLPYSAPGATTVPDPVIRWVESVKAEAALARTAVTLQAGDTTIPDSTSIVAAVEKLIETYQDLEAYGIAADTQTAQTVLATLRGFVRAINPTMSADAIQGEAKSQGLNDAIDSALGAAASRGYSKLLPWLEDLKAGLDAALNPVTVPTLASRGSAPTRKEAGGGGPGLGTLAFDETVRALAAPPSLAPPGAAGLRRSPGLVFAPGSDASLRLLASLNPSIGGTLYGALESSTFTTPAVIQEINGLPVKAAVFGHNAPLKPVISAAGAITDHVEWPFDGATTTVAALGARAAAVTDPLKVLTLDAVYDKIVPNSWVVIKRPHKGTTSPHRVERVDTVSVALYGLTGRVTRLTLNDAWLDASDTQLSDIRDTSVYGASGALDPADGTIDPTGEPIVGDRIELDRLYDGLTAGRWLIISGERIDVPGATGVIGAELSMLGDVELSLDPSLPGDVLHSRLVLAAPLAYVYKRDTVQLYGNVAHATQGETRTQVLGSGDGSVGGQRFTLSQSPLTFVSASNPEGIASTLNVRVNEVLWHESDSVAGLGPTDRRYATSTDDKDKTTIIFGNGDHGARLPTGSENVRAVYRTGIGKSGNVGARRISLLATKPLGVKAVVNPLPATGGADRESRDSARGNAPLAVMALDRLVSIQDYADFARTFAGIGKATARRLSDGRRQLVHVTIAGEGDIPIAETSDLYRNLVRALREFGDPLEPIGLARRELVELVISARVRVQADYAWEFVEPRIRSALLQALGFDRRQIGQAVEMSEVVSIVQQVPGVDFVDLDVLAGVPETVSTAELQQLAPQLVVNRSVRARLAERDGNDIRPAQVVCLKPDVADVLILQEMTT